MSDLVKAMQLLRLKSLEAGSKGTLTEEDSQELLSRMEHSYAVMTPEEQEVYNTWNLQVTRAAQEKALEVEGLVLSEEQLAQARERIRAAVAAVKDPDPDPYIGWYSEKQRQIIEKIRYIEGYKPTAAVRYRTPSNGVVLVTDVRRRSSGRPRFDDAVCLGVVVGLVEEQEGKP